MDIGAKRAIKVVAIALITTVVLQIVYMAFLGGPKPLEEGAALTNADVIRYFDERGNEIRLVWTLEAVAFLSIALGSLIALVNHFAGREACCMASWLREPHGGI